MINVRLFAASYFRAFSEVRNKALRTKIFFYNKRGLFRHFIFFTTSTVKETDTYSQ